MAVNVKMGVDIGGFRAGIKEGQTILKSLDAEMKVAEAEFKATGNAEQLMSTKTKMLTSQLNIQKAIVNQAQAALKAMTDAGINPADKAYQQLNVTMLKAQAGMYEAQAALNGLDGSQQQAAASADALTQSVSGIGKKISLDQVISGIDKITGGLEKAAKKAVDLGKSIWDEIMNSARWADDTATMAQMYGIDLDQFLRIQKLVQNGMDTSVEAILKSQSKLKKGIGEDSKSVMEALDQLGISVKEWQTVAGESGSALMSRDSVDLFWEAGKAIMAMGDEFQQEAMAQAIFGRSWHELVPLFEQFQDKDAFNEALQGVEVESKSTIENLAELNNKIGELEGNFNTLKNEVIGSIAPALSGAADTLSGLLEKVLEYLKTPEGQKALEDLGTAVSGLFEDLGKIEPDKVVEGFVGVFDNVVKSVQWLVDNSGSVIGALEAIVAGWGALKLTGGILDIVKLVNGIRGMQGASSAYAAAGTAAGASWGGAFAAAVLAAAPWLLAVWAANAIPEENKLGNEERVEAATYTEEELARLREWVQLQNELKGMEGKYGTEDFDEAAYNSLIARLGELGNVQQGDLWSRYWDYLAANNIMPGFDQMPTDFLDSMLSQITEENRQKLEESLWDPLKEKLARGPVEDLGEVPVEVTPEVVENAAEMIAEDVGTVTVPVTLVWDRTIGGAGGGKDWNSWQTHANGLPYVPYDGYLARLHKGEMVVPAREISSRSFSSNLYVENMNMSGGLSADALAAAIAGRNRRMMAGYGS